MNERVMEAFHHCGARAKVYRFDDEEGGYTLRAQYCHCRWCRPCAKSHALMIADNLRSRMTSGFFSHLVLTMKHRPEDFASGRQRLYTAFKSLRSKSIWKRNVDGGAVFYQTHVAGDGMWHHHIHAIIESRWIPHLDLVAQWHAITGDSYNVHIKRISNVEGAIKEVTRYAAAPADKDLVADPERLAEMIRGLHGSHLCFCVGKWRGWRLTKRRTWCSRCGHEFTATETECPTCGRARFRPMTFVADLPDLIALARAGVHGWQHVLDIIRRTTCASNAPPTGNTTGSVSQPDSPHPLLPLEHT